MSNIFDLFKKIEKKATPLAVTHIVAGLGNVGAQYEGTRHNAGFIALDYIAERVGARVDRVKFHSLLTEATLGKARVILMKPTTYMNNSGVSIAEAAAFYKIPPERVIVLHDEISFDAGSFRIRRRGSAGGHNGLKSIISHLASEDFPRIKIGVGKKPTPDYDLADWVLGKFPRTDFDALGSRLPDILSSVELIIAGNIDEAMNRFSK